MKDLLASVIDRFKVKNPVVFAVIATILLFGAGCIEYVTTQQICITDALGVTDCDLVLNPSTVEILNKVKYAMMMLATLLGAHTKTAPVSTQKA